MPMSDSLKRRMIARGELLAVSSDVVQEDRGAFFWLFAPPTPKNERCGSVMVVRVSGPLDYHDDYGCDSYEAIVERLRCAFAGKIDDEDPSDSPPSAVVMRIDSPGGVVAGLHETVMTIRKMSADAGIMLYAYVDETAYSAAYALSCAAEERVLPRSGFCGSIGVISTLVDQTKADEKAGLRFVILTSGARKADGHPHAPITDEMIEEERPRVEQLAEQFFQDVSDATALSVDKIRSFEAKRFLGFEAVKERVANKVMGWSKLIKKLNAQAQDGAQASGTTQKGVPDSTSEKGNEAEMLSLNALIARTEKALKSEKDPQKLLALAGQLEAYKKTKTHIEKHETEEGEDDADEEEESSASEEEEEESKGDETDRSEDDPDDDDDDSDSDSDDDEAEEEEEEEEASAEETEEASAKAAASAIVRSSGLTSKSARRALARAAQGMILKAVRGSAAYKVFRAASKITHKKSAGAIVAALRGHADASNQLKRDVAEMKANAARDRKSALIDKARTQGRITPAQAKSLGSKKLAFVESFLDMHPNAIVKTPANPTAPPPTGAHRGSVAKSGDPDVEKEIAQAMAAFRAQGIKITEEQLRAQLNATATTALPEN
jgi:ClpP class serine protease